jgi:hypothetical protein
MGLQRKIGEILECEISGHPAKLRRVKGRYDFESDKSRCPICGSIGIPWGGMFHCEGDHHHKAVIETGQCFVKAA